jgi:gamma-glutamyltranspeptidase/glutathione hydrolase
VAALFEPAIALAENGFAMSPRLSRARGPRALHHAAALRAYLYDANGKVLPVARSLRNPGVRQRRCARSRATARAPSTKATSRATSSTP